MKEIAEFHQHHRFGSPDCYGFRLESGDELQPTDMYSSTSGEWQPCPCPGLTLGDVDVIWVRPA